MKKNGVGIRVATWTALICCFVLLVVSTSRCSARRAEERKQAQIPNNYNTALDYLAREKYEEALSYLALTEGYEDSAALVTYAKAAQTYDPLNNSNCEAAYAYCEAFPPQYTGAYAAEMQTLKAEVAEQKALYDEEQRILAAAQAELEAEQYLAEVQKRAPFEGMRAEYIDETRLGLHNSSNKINEILNGIKYPATIYRWDGYGTRGDYVASVVDGEVVRVYEYKNSTYNNAYNPVNSLNNYNGNSASKKRSTKPKKDALNAADYSDPDDFYYDHYDEFWEFEDAEDYWREHS